MRIGLCGVWTNARGGGIVNQRLYRALVEMGHEVHVLGRPAEVMGHRLLDETPLPHLRLHATYAMNPNTVQAWAAFTRVEAVLFGEEMNFALPLAVQRMGLCTMAWIDAYLAPSWKLLLKAYDQLWCITHRAEGILQDWGKAEKTAYIGWGVPDELFVDPATAAPPRYDLMHSAGWIGIDARKGTDTLLAALALMGDEAPEVLLHCQMPEAEAKRRLGVESWPPHIVYEDADVPPPGLYGLGRVVVQPSKVEGIGLSLPEAMCAGRPVITVDAPPMTEFITPQTGCLVDVDRWQPHVDGSVYTQALVRPEALAKVLQEAMQTSDATLAERSRETLARAHDLFDWRGFQARVSAALERLESR